MATSFIDTFETASISLWSILLQVAVTMSHSGLKSEKDVQFRQGKRYSLPCVDLFLHSKLSSVRKCNKLKWRWRIQQKYKQQKKNVAYKHNFSFAIVYTNCMYYSLLDNNPQIACKIGLESRPNLISVGMNVFHVFKQKGNIPTLVVSTNIKLEIYENNAP